MDSAPAARPSLQITPLPTVVLPIRGRIEALEALDDGGYVVADEHDALSIRRIDASLVQQWEYTLDGYPSSTFHFRDLLVTDDAVWVALTFKRWMTIEGTRLTAVGATLESGPTFDPDLLLLEFSLAGGTLRAFHQLGDHASVGPTQIAHHGDTLYIAAAYVSASRDDELDWGKRRVVNDTDGVIVVALSTNGTQTWSKRFKVGWIYPEIIADDRRVAVSGSSGRDFETGGKAVVRRHGSQALWIADLTHDGELTRLEELYHPAHWSHALPIGEGELGYLMGGAPPNYGVWDPDANEYVANELPCRNCKAESAWRADGHTMLITSGDDEVHVDLASQGGGVLDSDVIASPFGPSFVVTRGRGNDREIVIWRWWTNVLLRARVAITS